MLEPTLKTMLPVVSFLSGRKKKILVNTYHSTFHSVVQQICCVGIIQHSWDTQMIKTKTFALVDFIFSQEKICNKKETQKICKLHGCFRIHEKEKVEQVKVNQDALLEMRGWILSEWSGQGLRGCCRSYHFIIENIVPEMNNFLIKSSSLK